MAHQNVGKIAVPNRRRLPAELVYELFAALPIPNAYALLVQMPNGLLARNMRQKAIEMIMKTNKWNSADCMPLLRISGNGLCLTKFGPNGWYSVRAIMPIPRFNSNAKKLPYIAAYFEVEILKKRSVYWLGIGFCGKQFPLEEKYLGTVDSIGFGHKGTMRVDGHCHEFKNGRNRWFTVGEVLGCGIIHYPANLSAECFATCDGNFLGKFRLPSKFIGIQLFPAANLCGPIDSMQANFGKKKWRYNFNNFTQLMQWMESDMKNEKRKRDEKKCIIT